MPPRANRLLPFGLALGLLCGCAGPGRVPEGEPTLSVLAGREAVIAEDPGVVGGEAEARAAYRGFLDTAAQAAQRAEALRRLGDLDMDGADRRAADAEAAPAPDYRAAMAAYREQLSAHPGAPGNDRVLYQLARAHEQGGEQELALATLDRLLAEYPRTAFHDEVQFRRGELLFGTRQYARAEGAYTEVLKGEFGNPYRDRALYMQGWSRMKQGHLEAALQAFLAVLDRKVAFRGGAAGVDGVAGLAGLSPADRELVEDTLRGASLSLASLRGAESIAAFIDSAERRSYEALLYVQLGELYLKQERIKDAADTLALFARSRPLHPKAPALHARVVEIHAKAGFTSLAAEAKKDYVTRYGADGEFRRANPDGWEGTRPRVRTYLAELARHHHSAAQKSKASADYQEAVRWYRALLDAFPDDAEAVEHRFLLAEALFEDRRYAEAAREYETTAYGGAGHARSADAGYAALLGHAEVARLAAPAEAPARRRDAVASALRFAERFAADPRAGAVLADAAEHLYALGDTAEAIRTAQRVLALEPAPPAAQRRVALTVLGHTAFERAAYVEAERAYAEAVGLAGEKDKAHGELVERLAASIYQQGEQARAAGRGREAVEHFERVAVAAPQSALRATAQYDAAAALIALKDWDAAARTLEDFRRRHPGHPLQAGVGAKLAAAYVEKGEWSRAADEFERIAAAAEEPALARDALWQVAELRDRTAAAAAGRDPAARTGAARAWERYLQRHPEPVEPALEARWRLARLARENGDASREQALLEAIVQAEQRGGAVRTERTRALGAAAALALAEPAAERYRKVALVEPLARQLALKKARMEEALQAYGRAADYGVAEVTTAATHQVAALYQDFGKALLGSQRPAQLSGAEREQYDVLLEEQAFPFEEKAIELHEANAGRARLGLYDEWVRRSFAALRELRPARYGKFERSEAVIDEIR